MNVTTSDGAYCDAAVQRKEMRRIVEGAANDRAPGRRAVTRAGASDTLRAMRRPWPRALFVGLLAASVLSLSVQHALYLCGASEHASATRAAEAHAGCHDAGDPSSGPADGQGAPACCGAAGLASLPSGREAAGPDALGPPLPLHATAWSAVTVLASAEATLRSPGRGLRVERLRPHLALRKILV